MTHERPKHGRGGRDWTAGIPACHAREATVKASVLSNQNLVYAVEATALQAGMPAVQSVGDVSPELSNQNCLLLSTNHYKKRLKT
jgi:hypothetical protein